MRTIKCLWFGGFVFLMLVLTGHDSYPQTQEAKQLMLNVEKLAQLRNILSDMKKGYDILLKGYNSVKDIAEGNFSLHELFLDGLLVVSPEVKKYARVADIIADQRNIGSEYMGALNAFNAADVFGSGELSYLKGVYEGLSRRSLQNVEDLALVLTSSKLRMSDGERLTAIDRIYLDTRDQLVFLRDFNAGAVLLMRQKQKEKREIEQLKSIYKQN
jgi:hypothetical protein